MHRVVRGWQMLQAWDEAFLAFGRTHLPLWMALLSSLLAVFGLFSGFPWFSLRLALIGSLAYFGGLVPALCVGFFSCTAWAVDGFLHPSMTTDTTLSLAIVQGIGVVNICWLGYHHAMLRRQQEARTRGGGDGLDVGRNGTTDSVLPWRVVNDIRSSLAAVRFLLFPLRDGVEDGSVRAATSELERLESLFQGLTQRPSEQSFEKKDGESDA